MGDGGRDVRAVGVPMSGRGVIAPEKPQRCELCGKVRETRPYGPKGERVCFDCGMKDPAACDRGAARYLGVTDQAARPRPEPLACPPIPCGKTVVRFHLADQGGFPTAIVTTGSGNGGTRGHLTKTTLRLVARALDDWLQQIELAEIDRREARSGVGQTTGSREKTQRATAFGANGAT